MPFLFLFICFIHSVLLAQNTPNQNLNSIEKSELYTFEIVTLSKNLKSPWGIAALPSSPNNANGGLLITEKQSGSILYWNQNQLHQLGTIESIANVGQGGLLDIALSPGFKTNQKIYFTSSTFYNNNFTEYCTALSSATVNLKNKTLDNIRTLFLADNVSENVIHFGSRIAFDERGYLYLTLGDRGEKYNAQSLKQHHGKVIRLGLNNNKVYVPRDNPFFNSNDYKKEIYSYGHRNPQGLIFFQGKLWLHEHGPKGGDEINLIRPAKNYGWPIITHGKNYDGSTIGNGKTQKKGMEQPFLHWTPSIAPCGMAVYTGNKFPLWKSNFFVGALVGQHLRRVVIKDSATSPTLVKQEKLLIGKGRIRDVEQGSDGYLYVITDSWNGKLLQLRPIKK